MLKLTSTQPGPRGFNAVGGPVLVEAGQTVEAEVFHREKEGLEACGWFEIKGSYKADPEGSVSVAQASRAAINDAVAEAESKAAAEHEKVIGEKDAEIADLKKQLAATKKS